MFWFAKIKSDIFLAKQSARRAWFQPFLTFSSICVSFLRPLVSNVTDMTDCNRKIPVIRTQEPCCDDATLVKRFSQGDQTAFEIIIETHRRDVAALANRLLGWSGDVDDICQEVFLAVYLGLKSFRHQSSIKTWLFRITINKCRNHERRRMLGLKFFRHTLQVNNNRAEPSRSDSDDDQSICIRNAVRSLPRKYREPIILKYLNELSSEQICDLLGITKNALHVRLSRSRNMLKEQLTDLVDE